MNSRKFRKALTVFAGALALVYFALLIVNRGHELPMETQEPNTEHSRIVAIFGATGSIGDGLLKAAMNDPNIEKIHVVTRRPSPRIEEGVESGKVEMTIHKNYLDYSAIQEVLTEVDAVYWAIGLSAVGLDQETYREIHVDYPAHFVAAWLDSGRRPEVSFHYVSGSGANADSRMMWAQEKAHAEAKLAGLAERTNLRIVSYRPAFIRPTEAEAHFGHRLMHAILNPIGASVAVEAIGAAMLEVSARERDFANGTVLENRDIISLSNTYEQRRQR